MMGLCDLTCPSYEDIVAIIESTTKKNYDFLRRFADQTNIYVDLLRRVAH